MSWTLHDLRRTGATGLAKLGIQLPVVERLLNHKGVSFSGVAGIYQQHEYLTERRAALDAWAAHIERLLSGQQPTNVVQISRGGRA